MYVQARLADCGAAGHSVLLHNEQTTNKTTKGAGCLNITVSLYAIQPRSLGQIIGRLLLALS